MKNLMTATLVVASLTLIGAAAHAADKKEPLVKEELVVERTYISEKPGLDQEQISVMQQSLSDKGFYKGAISGKWDAATNEAIKSYQASRQEQPSGILTSVTLKDLNVPERPVAIYDAANPTTGTNVEYRTEREFKTTTIEKVDIVTHGNGPHARGRAAFLD